LDHRSRSSALDRQGGARLADAPRRGVAVRTQTPPRSRACGPDGGKEKRKKEGANGNCWCEGQGRVKKLWGLKVSLFRARVKSNQNGKLKKVNKGSNPERLLVHTNPVTKNKP